jgi:hypothetical protein
MLSLFSGTVTPVIGARKPLAALPSRDASQLIHALKAVKAHRSTANETSPAAQAIPAPMSVFWGLG